MVIMHLELERWVVETVRPSSATRVGESSTLSSWPGNLAGSS